MIRVELGDCRDILRTLPGESVHCCVTSPPYWGLRDYGLQPVVWGGLPGCEHKWGETIAVNATNHTDKRRWQHTRNGRDEEQPTEKRVAWLRTTVPQGQFCQKCNARAGCLGLEPTPQLYVEHIVEVFREVRRVLRADGTLWLNLGDSYAATTKGSGGHNPKQDSNQGSWFDDRRWQIPDGLKPKDLCGIPWRVAFALQADGWTLRSEIIWAKPNPMPESVRDRPTKAHEQIFLLAKSQRYFFNQDAVREPHREESLLRAKRNRFGGKYQGSDPHEHGALKSGNGYGAGADNGVVCSPAGRNIRSVWTVPTQPYTEAHFATFPEEIAKRCILAGCPKGGTVLDPFAGSGTVGQVAQHLECAAILIEANPDYIPLIRRRCAQAPLFTPSP